MPSVALSSHIDIAAALRKLGVQTAQLSDPGAAITALQSPAGAARTAEEKELAAAVKVALSTFSPGEMGRLKATFDAAPASAQAAAAAATTSPARSGVGGGGVNGFNLQGRLPVRGHGDQREPKLDGNTPAVAAFLKSYGVDKPVGRPLERVLVPAAKLNEMLKSAPTAEKLVDVMMAGDARRTVFLLEGVLKLYSRNYGGSAEKNYASVKLLEDSLGQYACTRSITKAGLTRQVPAAVQAVLEKNEAKARLKLVNLIDKEWLPGAKGKSPGMKEIVHGIGEDKWDSYADDKKYVRTEVVRRLKSLEAEPFSMTELETGIHELRRQLRWIPIYTEGVNGLVQLDPTHNPIADYKPLLDADIGKSKFVDLPPPDREADPIVVSKSVYAAVMQMTLDLGAIKDRGEECHFLAHAYMEAGLAHSPGQATKLVEALLGQTGLEKAMIADAKKVYAEFKKVRQPDGLTLLSALRADFKG